MTEALAGDDVEAWIALTDLDPAGEQQQRDWFAAVQAVPMQVREMHPTFLFRIGHAPGHATATFAFRHQVSGVDPVPVLEEYELTLTSSGSGWLVAGVGGTSGVDRTYPQLWDLGPVGVVETGRTVVVHSGDPPPNDALRSLDAAVGAVLDAFPLEGEPQRLLVEYAEAATMGEMLSLDVVDAHSQGYVPLASAEVELIGPLPDLEDGSGGTPRLIVNRGEHEAETDYYAGVRGGSPLTRYGLSYLVLSLRHQDFMAPEWVDTGLAWWFELSGDDWVRREVLLGYPFGVGDVSEVTGFPPDNYWEFYGDESTMETYQYQAATIMLFLEERHGRDVLVTFAEAMALVDIYAPDADEVMDEIFREHLGAPRADVEADWVDWLQEEYGQGQTSASGARR